MFAPAPAPEPPSNIYISRPLSPARCPGQFHSIHALFTSRLPLSTGFPSPSPKSMIHSFPAMNHYSERRVYDFYEEEDPYSTPRAGSFDCVDAVLPWRFEEPPPVPAKNDLKARSATASTPTGKTPWLHRSVNVTRAAQKALTRAPQKASSTTDIRGSPKPQPPAYHAVQQQIHPSEERLAITTRGGGPQSAVQVQPRTPPNLAVAHRSARGETQAQRSPKSHSGSPKLRSVRSAHEERSRPGRSRTPAPAPLRPAAASVQPERGYHLPSYHSAEPFPPFPPPPPPPPYQVSAEDGYRTSVRSRSLPRNSRKHGPTFEKEATPLPPLPSHPRLSGSAISRIQAGHKVSKEFGDAIMKQELRLATPTLDHSRLDYPVPNPRFASGRRFLSTSELQGQRKALRTDKITPEHEACQRTSNKSSSNVARCPGDSRHCTTSAHPGGGQDKGSQRGRR